MLSKTRAKVVNSLLTDEMFVNFFFKLSKKYFFRLLQRSLPTYGDYSRNVLTQGFPTSLSTSLNVHGFFGKITDSL